MKAQERDGGKEVEERDQVVQQSGEHRGGRVQEGRVGGREDTQGLIG